ADRDRRVDPALGRLLRERNEVARRQILENENGGTVPRDESKRLDDIGMRNRSERAVLAGEERRRAALAGPRGRQLDRDLSAGLEPPAVDVGDRARMKASLERDSARGERRRGV